jgi:hypothetical protein
MGIQPIVKVTSYGTTEQPRQVGKEVVTRPVCIVTFEEVNPPPDAVATAIRAVYVEEPFPVFEPDTEYVVEIKKKTLTPSVAPSVAPASGSTSSSPQPSPPSSPAPPVAPAPTPNP